MKNGTDLSHYTSDELVSLAASLGLKLHRYANVAEPRYDLYRGQLWLRRCVTQEVAAKALATRIDWLVSRGARLITR